MPVWSRRCGGGGIDAASFGVSGHLFGIHRYRSESELGFASEVTRRRNRKTQIAIAVVIASVASLFVCLLIMDLTQNSKTSEQLVTRQTPAQSDKVEPINSTIDVLGLWQDKQHPRMESQITSDLPSSRNTDEMFLPTETEGPSQTDQVEETESPTTSTLPPTIEDVTDTNELSAVDTTPLPETDKKAGVKLARSLPEDRLRPWPSTGTLAPDKDLAYARTLEALPYLGQDAGLAQWGDMQKKSSMAVPMPVPAFDTNKWLEALRAQYQQQLDKAGWANRVADAANVARNPRPFLPGTDPAQNQFLVVNNRGVVIPNSVQFPEVVKSAAYPQLQTYRYPQTSRNIQDILRYVTGSGNNRLRQTQWPTAVKKAAKVAGMYVTPNDNFAAGTYVASRPEAAYLAATTATTPPGGKPLNGHAYISDPFHPYKPADPTEINHLADHNPGFGEGELPAYTYPGKSTKHSHLRNPFGNKAQPTPYTTAVFKPLGNPLGNPDQMATSTANVDSLMQYFPQQQKRGVPPLSVMLEIYPMSSDDSRATVPFRGTATSNVFRRPATSMSLLQNKEPSVRRPVALAVDASVASSQTVNVPLGGAPLGGAPLQFQPQAHQQGTPAFGMTLAGLPPLPGMGPADSKHRMVVHLNFYPKKTPSPINPRLRDPTEELQAALAGQTDASTGVFSADYPQRRQSGMNGRKHSDVDNASQVNAGAAKGNYFPGNSVVQAEFDASSLASVLPKDVVQRFSEFLRAASPDHQHQTNYDSNDSGGDFGPDSTEDREDHVADDDEEDSEEDSEEDDEDDEEGRIVPYPEEHRRATHRRRPPMLRTPEIARVPFHRLWRSGGNVSWSDVQYDDDEEDESVGEVEGRDVGNSDTSPKMNIMPAKTKVTVAREKSNETKTTTAEPDADDEPPERPYKPRRRLIIEASPKNHRMQ